MNYFNLDVKEIFIDKLNFSISNYDGKVYHYNKMAAFTTV